MFDGRKILSHQISVFSFLIQNGVDVDIDDDGVQPLPRIFQVMHAVVDIPG